MNATTNTTATSTISDENFGIPAMTAEMIWTDYMADIADTISAHLPISEKELKGIRKLKPRSSNIELTWNAGKPSQHFKLLLQANGLLWIYDYSRGDKFSEEIKVVSDELQAYKEDFLASMKAL